MLTPASDSARSRLWKLPFGAVTEFMELIEPLALLPGWGDWVCLGSMEALSGMPACAGVVPSEVCILRVAFGSCDDEDGGALFLDLNQDDMAN